MRNACVIYADGAMTNLFMIPEVRVACSCPSDWVFFMASSLGGWGKLHVMVVDQFYVWKSVADTREVSGMSLLGRVWGVEEVCWEMGLLWWEGFRVWSEISTSLRSDERSEKVLEEFWNLVLKFPKKSNNTEHWG